MTIIVFYNDIYAQVAAFINLVMVFELYITSLIVYLHVADFELS